MRVPEELSPLFDAQNPFRERRAGLSDAKMIYFADGNNVLAPIYGAFVQNSPLELRKSEDGRCYIFERDEQLTEVLIPSAPGWYSRPVSDEPSDAAAKYVQMHSIMQLASMPFANCALFANGTPCKFCAVGYNARRKPKPVGKIARAVEFALEELPYFDITLNTGWSSAPSAGAEFIAPVASAISATCSIRVAAEVNVPRDVEGTFKLLKDSGVSAIILNLECWNDEARRVVAPIKADKRAVMRALEGALKFFGVGAVSSVLIIGAEPKEETVRGAEELIKLSILPDVLVYRPTDGSLLAAQGAQPPPFEDVRWVMRNVRELKDKYQTWKLIAGSAGCTKCGGCSITTELLGLPRQSRERQALAKQVYLRG
ncbi:Uncharacterised protein [Candidatus Burarchaeum australiense]|nr:Uncharacterised protein [Candidatus Burarchaeum australiense]